MKLVRHPKSKHAPPAAAVAGSKHRLSTATVDTIEEGVAYDAADVPPPPPLEHYEPHDEDHPKSSTKKKLLLSAMVAVLAVAAIVCGVLVGVRSKTTPSVTSSQQLADKDAEMAALRSEVEELEAENEGLKDKLADIKVEVQTWLGGDGEPDMIQEQGGVDSPDAMIQEQEVEEEAVVEPAEAELGVDDEEEGGRLEDILMQEVVTAETEQAQDMNAKPAMVEDILDGPATMEIVNEPEEADEEEVGEPLIQESPVEADEEPTIVAASIEEDEAATNSMDDGESEAAASAPTVEVEDTLYDAIVVGSGWAGLRAAQVLSSEGHSVLVLEANDYIGGRAKTLQSALHPDVPTDVGCEWLYSDAVGSMESELLDSGLMDDAREHDYMAAMSKTVTYLQAIGEDGEVTAVPMEGADKLSAELWGDFMSYKKEVLKALGDVSYADALEQFMDENDLTNTEEQHLNLLVDLAETEFAGDADEMSLEEVEAFYMDPGCELDTHYMPSPGVGFGNTAVALAERIDAEFRLNSRVTSIDYEDDDVIIVYEEKGVTKQVAARTALVTVSLGVLKAGTISFQPELPEYKQDVIDKMGFGLLNKACLYWADDDDIVWPEDKEWFELITPEDHSSGDWTTWLNPSEMKNVPTLTGWIAGSEAEAMEEKSDEEIMEHIMTNLRSMFPDIRDPDEVTITRWGQEENVRGSYSFNIFGRSFVDDAEALREPVGNVWFAGEATNMDGWHATTVGAWDSGEGAAKEMASVL